MADHPTAPIRLRKVAVPVLALLLGALVCETASAHGYNRGGYYRGGPRVGVGVVIGAPIFGPWYYPRPYYYPRSYYYPRPYYYPPPVIAYPPPVVTYPPAAYPPVTYPPVTYPPSAYPPAVVPVPGSPPVYVEKGQDGAAPAAPAPPQAAQPATWYYCPSAKGYYPYVSQCPGGWQAVPAQPPPPPPPN